MPPLPVKLFSKHLKIFFKISFLALFRASSIIKADSKRLTFDSKLSLISVSIGYSSSILGLFMDLKPALVMAVNNLSKVGSKFMLFCCVACSFLLIIDSTASLKLLIVSAIPRLKLTKSSLFPVGSRA